MAHPKGVDETIKLYQVTGIDEPYNIRINSTNAVPAKLSHAVPVAFCLVDGKHSEDQLRYGGIVGLADDAAILDTEHPLDIFGNIRIDAGGELYGKVMEKSDEGYIIRFTSVPSGYRNWLRVVGIKE
ncbi:MAG: hypothetical protein K6E91_02375 [Butyrivibrio sp.]|nr:hypothetical protein [Butyrivibrio sp.]